MKEIGLFSSYYLAPIEFYYYLTQYLSIIVDVNENFVKQSYRSRKYIMGPNGVQSLTIPLIHIQKRQKLKEVKISYAENWQKIHWKSIEAGYRRSPYFEYYEDNFYNFFHTKTEYLLDFNTKLHEKVMELLGISCEIQISEKYIEPIPNMDDYRTKFSPKQATNDLIFPEYYQVFNDRNSFTPNLSIVDLLFNEGPNSLNYLKTISK